MLTQLWKHYRTTYPQLDQLMCDWMFDFTRTYSLPYQVPEESNVQLPSQTAQRNLLIHTHRGDKPLKLTWDMICILSDYQMEQSSFYQADHQQVIREAIPRVIALADAALLKKGTKGILAIYAPHRTASQNYKTFAGSLCPDADRTVSVNVINYCSSRKLREYITMLVKYTENVFRSIYCHRGRLRGITLDPEIAAHIETFLKKEYSPSKTKDSKTSPSISLDFDNIDALRRQSDAVRDALEVQEESSDVPLSQLEEVRAFFEVLSGYGRNLLDKLFRNHWEMPMQSEYQSAFSEINLLSQRYLARQMLVMEGNQIILEDDFRDEMNQIYSGIAADPENPDTPVQHGLVSRESNYFDKSLLTEPVNSLLQALLPYHIQAVYLVTSNDTPMERLEELANENLTMPEIILDEINDMALQFLDDILIDTLQEPPRVCEQYESELKQARK